LNALEGYLAELRSFRTRSRAEFVREPALHHLAERFLQLACECVLDIAHHVIADQGYRQSSSYKDTMDVLKEEGLLDDDLADRLKGWMGFRNLLVHFYLDVDHGRSFDAIQNDLGDLEAFARSMAPLLDEPGS
jgi:uncharacterized protein YutE (UPF0331/DUF86 family)